MSSHLQDIFLSPLIINGMIFLMGESFGESPKGEGMTKIRGPPTEEPKGGLFP
jgi:hypothetical protein